MAEAGNVQVASGNAPLEISADMSSTVQGHAGLEDSPGEAEPLVGKPATNVRAPKPASLTWPQARQDDPNRLGRHGESAYLGIGAVASGPVSPTSPRASSEGFRSPTLSDRQMYAHRQPSSPGAASQVPRLHSPASQIFERSVQEDMLPSQASPSIPAHLRTENYIPPVLEASSAAITDEHLDPDSVEILTHSIHQPAAATMNGSSTADQSLASSSHLDQSGFHSFETDEASSAHAVADPTDVRRLSFISFADVVNAEHAESGDLIYRESSMGGGSGHLVGAGRSPSPLRSPTSSHGLGTSPPTSIAASFKGMDMTPNNGTRGPGSPLPMAQSPVSSNFGGELQVETMRQALRRTGSGDLSGFATQASTGFGGEETPDRHL
ncbi:hypothetical protein N7539_009070 [Penicillium diatomitis]|uniref:Uncharacterized protein n=1 Tax=Penicillium diatomitis TaxID=2819901 RepID=A0A9W9WL76_9EURO|nr:uncharacterized protein N7539_009070 [Penicillium diatomitis]KAJ5469452.1 hypothetical protein N7539_009070 [Penicillium diatomitis]